MEPRKKSAKFFFLWFSLALLFLGGAVLGSLYFLFYSPALKVTKTEVRGLRIVAAEDFTAKMRALYISQNSVWNLLGTDNILFWKFAKKPSLVSMVLPAVRSVSVETNLGERTVSFGVGERVFGGIWCRSGGQCYGFDASGVIFSEVPQAEGSLILRVEDENLAPPILGRGALPYDSWFQNLLRTVSILRAKGMVIAEIIVKDFGLREWEVVSASRTRLLFSFNFVPDNLERVLENLRPRLAGSKLAYLDFRVPNRIYYK